MAEMVALVVLPVLKEAQERCMFRRLRLST